MGNKLWYNSPDLICLLNRNHGVGILDSDCPEEHWIFGTSRGRRGLREVTTSSSESEVFSFDSNRDKLKN